MYLAFLSSSFAKVSAFKPQDIALHTSLGLTAKSRGNLDSSLRTKIILQDPHRSPNYFNNTIITFYNYRRPIRPY